MRHFRVFSGGVKWKKSVFVSQRKANIDVNQCLGVREGTEYAS